MFVRFKENIRQEKNHHMFRDTSAAMEVYQKVQMNDGKDSNGEIRWGHAMYLLKPDKGNHRDFDCTDYVAQYGDKEIFRHPDFQGFPDDLEDQHKGYDGAIVGKANGYCWVSFHDLEELVADNNAAYKFLLKSK